MDKRWPPLPLPSLPALSHQQQPRAPARATDGGATLESSLLLLLCSSSAASAASAGLPLPSVLALPLAVHLQPQQQPPLLVLVPPPPPPQPQSICRKRLLPRIVPFDGGHAEVQAAVPLPMPVSRSTSNVSTASSARSIADAVSSMAVADSSSGPVEPGMIRGTQTVKTITTTSSNTLKQKQPKKKRVRIKTDRRREQCRANQARYRTKQRGETVVLEERVEELRAEVSELERQRQERNNSRNYNSSGAPMHVVREYFRLFRHGLSENHAKGESQTADQQIAFLRLVMVPDLEFGDFRGVDALIEQWRRYSRFYGEPLLTLESACSVENVSLGGRVGCVIHSTATLMLTITPETIQHVFPHLEAIMRLKSKLLGQRVAFPCTLVLEFDEIHKVQSLTCSVEYVASLQKIIGDVRDVAVVLENARIQHDFFLLSEGE